MSERGSGRGREIALIGAPVEAGAGVAGCGMGPAMLRAAGLARSLGDLGYAVFDRGDIAPETPAAVAAPAGRARNFGLVAGFVRTLAVETYAAMAAGRIPLTLGGDHSLAMGSVGGVARWAAKLGRPLFVLWLDAHSDFNTPATSPSGNMHGMPAAMLAREPGLEGVFGEAPHGTIEASNLHLFGIRSIDDGERRLLRSRGVDVVDMRQIDEFGVVAPLRRIVERVKAAGGLLHVSLDVDFLDPAIAPGVGTPAPGGATYREAHLTMEMLYDSGLVASLDLVELNPFLDERAKSALLMVDLAASLFGRQVY